MTVGCVQCGYCCTVAPCSFGVLGANGVCTYLTADNLCGRYGELKDDPKAYHSPAFGAGCCSPLFNTRRQRKMREVHFG